jgi:hypothetical protein
MKIRMVAANLLAGAAVGMVCYGIGVLIGEFINGFTAKKVNECSVCYTTASNVVIPCKDHTKAFYGEEDWEAAFNAPPHTSTPEQDAEEFRADRRSNQAHRWE